jgi:hypothetical protein
MVYVNDTERERLASTIRGIVIKPPETQEAPTVAEVERLFRVQK